MTRQTTQSRYRWTIAGGLFLFLAINFADKAVIGLAAEPIMRELQLSHAQFGRIAASFFALFSVSAVVVGLLANRVKTRWLLAAMAVVWSVAQLPLLLFATPLTLLISRVLLGASEGPAYPVAVHALYKWFPDHERTLPSSILTIGGAFGAGFIAPLITTVIVSYGWQAAFKLLAIVGLVWGVFWLWVGKEGPLDVNAESTAIHDDASSLPARVPMRTLLLARTFVGANLCGFAAYVILSVATVWLPSYLIHVGGYSLVQVGWIGVLPAFGQIVAGPLLAAASQRMMTRGVSSRHARGTLGAVVVVISGAALATMPLLAPGALLIGAITIAFSLAPFTFVSGATLAGEVAPPGQRGGVLGVNICITTLAGLITPVIMGHMIDHASNPLAGYRSAVVLAGLFSVGAGLVGALLIDPAGDRRRFVARADSQGPVAVPSGINPPGLAE